MRLPVRSETDAFHLVCALVVLAAVELLLGGLLNRVVGIVVFCVGLLAIVAGAFASDHPSSALARAEVEGNEAKAPRRILLVANETPHGDQLAREIFDRGEPPTMLEVLAPVLQSRTHFATTDIDDEIEQARARLHQTLETAREYGLLAAGKIGDPIDPFAGLEDELRSHRIEEVIIATHPAASANWVEAALLKRIHANLHTPVTHMVVDRAAPTALH